MNRKYILSFLAVLVFQIMHAQTIRYVKPVASGISDGSSWANASDDIQAMINASGANSQVWVAAGTYKPKTDITGNPNPSDSRNKCYTMKNQLTIYGGFAGNESLLSERILNTLAPSILSGDLDGDGTFNGNSKHVIYNSERFYPYYEVNNTAILDGFTITGGICYDGESGGGIANIIGSPTIRHCIFTGNKAAYGGGAFFVSGGNPVIENCSFINNEAFGTSSGLSVGIGGAIESRFFSNTTLQNCVFSGNKATYGGAISLVESGNYYSVSNCLFLNNTSTRTGGAIWSQDALIYISNSTFTGNVSAQGGDVIYDFFPDWLQLTNCIIWGNGANGATNDIDISYSNIAINNSIVQGGFSGYYNLNADPQFIGNGNLRLRPCSPAIDAGSDNAPLTDIDGNSRIDAIPGGGIVDMGAYEFQSQLSPSYRVYVRQGASGANNGSSWTNAFTTLQDALAMARSADCVQEIWVANGTYKPTAGIDRYASFSMKNGVSIYGGFAGTETDLAQRNWKINETILSGDIGIMNDMGDNSFRVLYNSGLDHTAVLDGFIIKDGNGNGGWPYDAAGGMYNEAASPKVVNCIFNKNTGGYAGAVFNYASAANFVNCVLSNNNGAGMYNWYSGASLTNCTVSGNTVGAIGASGTTSLVNVIVWANTYGVLADYGGGLFNATYSNIQAGWAGTGNINADPLFINSPADNLSLQPASPAINTGNNTGLPAGLTTDLANSARIQLGTVDMGAYEASCQAAGDPTVFGDNTWNVYAWNAGGFTNASSDAWNKFYSGYYTTPNQNFNSNNDFDNVTSPSNAANYQGCQVANDNHSWSAKRQGFTCGYYQLNIPVHDDEVQLLINGVTVFTHGGCCDGHNNVWSGFLGANDKIEFRITDGNLSSQGILDFEAKNVTITCPNPIVASVPIGLCNTAVTYAVNSNITPAPAMTYELSGATTTNGAFISGTGSGTLFNKGITTVNIKYNNGCSDVTCSFTVTVNDNQPPILQGTIPGGNVGNVCKSNAPVAPTEAAIAALYSDNCGTVTATFDNAMSGVTGDNCGWTATYTYLIKDGNNISAADAVVVYTGADNEKPTFTRPNDITIYTAANCSYDASVANTGDVTDEADNCSTGLNATYSDVKVDNCEGTYTITRKWSLTDNCGNAAADQYQTITVKDNTAPAFTRPADIAIPFTTTCTYDASLAATGDVTNEHDNCSTSLNATYSDVVSQCGYNTVITRTWSLVDNCGNAAANQVQTITVTDNNTPYIIYATKEAKFGEDNYINGDVGVADAKGKAEFKKGDVLNPYVVRAANINVQLPSMVSNKVFAPATGGPNPPFYAHVAALLSGNYDQAVNGVVPAGNYKNLKIKKGVTATITGSDYGKIEIEEGAQVTFTSSSINLEELRVGKGKKLGTTNVFFINCTAVKVKQKVTIEEDTRVNVGGPKVNVYLGDEKKDEDNFTVRGDGTYVTLNIMIPNGKLKINGGVDNCIMTGYFIVEKLESDGRNITWNKYGCLPVVALRPVITTITDKMAKPAEVKAFPNPNNGNFALQLKGYKAAAKAQLVILNGNGSVIERRTIEITGKQQTVNFNLFRYSSGMYTIQVITEEGMQTSKVLIQR